MRRLPSFAALVSAVLLTAAHASPGAAQVPTVALRGTVIDSTTGAPIVGALLELPKLHRTALSDSAGHFSFGQLPAGRQILRAGSLGYSDYAAALELPAAGTLVIALPPHPYELAALQVAVDSLEARRVRCACYNRLQMIVLGPRELSATKETNLRRLLDSLSWKYGPEQMTYHYAATGRNARLVVDEMGSPGGVADALEWYRPYEVARLELYRVRGSTTVGIRLYTPDFLLHMSRTNRGLYWICAVCPESQRSQNR
jgi:hypothetical protein